MVIIRSCRVAENLTPLANILNLSIEHGIVRRRKVDHLSLLDNSYLSGGRIYAKDIGRRMVRRADDPHSGLVTRRTGSAPGRIARPHRGPPRCAVRAGLLGVGRDTA